MTPKISFIEISAREDFPYAEKPNMHVFEPTLEALKAQTMKDFELIIVDALFHKRKDYFRNAQLNFKVKHVPAQPNTWIERGYPGICAQYNKGIIYADGELLFFIGDSYMVKADFMKSLWERYTQGFFPLAWYLYDNSFSETPYVRDKIDLQSAKETMKIAYPNQQVSSPIPYNILGYSGKQVSIEHRYDIAFKGNREVFQAPWKWWFGCSSASLAAMLTINGFNMKFDGDRMLLDCDVGSRLELAGYGRHLALFKNIFLIRIPTNASVWSSIVSKTAPSIKCQYPMIYYNRFFNLPQVNTANITEDEIKWIKEEFCAKHCDIREQCKKEHPWQYPFEHKAGYGYTSNKELFELWKKTPTIIDLRMERQKRIGGDEKYREGTFV